MENNKNYVGLQTCFICNEEPTGVLLDRRLKNSLDYKQRGLEICDKCKKKYLSKGVLLMEVDNNKEITGDFAVIKDSAYKKIFDTEIPEKKKCYVEMGVLEKMGVKE